jgi:uncharacterized protein (UPF0147 family)
MTELAQTPSAAELPSPGSDYLPTAPNSDSDPGERRRGGGGIWGLTWWLVGGAAGVAATVWFILFAPGETGSKAEWFFGAVVFVAILASIWQTHSILRQARRDAADAAERLRNELAAAQERSARELALIRSIHEAQMDSQREMARSELAAQVELARVERVHLLAQQQKLALVGVSRAVNANTQALASLWNHAASVLQLEDGEARERAMNPVFEEIAQVVNDFSIELANAHLLVEDDRLHRALDSVNDAVLMAMHVAEDVHVAVVEGREPEPKPIANAQRLMHENSVEARHLAWSLLRNGLDDSASPAP